MFPPTCSDPPTSDSLLRAICQEDATQEAWQRFVRTYGPVIYSWCIQRGLNRTHSEDATQRVWIRLHQILPQFQYDPRRSFRAWLRTVTQRVAIDFFRGEARHQVERDPGAGSDFVERLLERDLIDTAFANVKKVSNSRDWEVFDLIVVKERSSDEVAERLGIGRAEVYRARYRICQAVAAEIRRLEGEEPESV
jgi:RNA polymerase sigma factor (sigma-70 family)